MAMSLVERECNKCGRKFLVQKNFPCPNPGCFGTVCTVITLVASKQVFGVLRRSWYSRIGCNEIYFSTKESVMAWTRKKWQKQYGSLPKKGSEEAVLLEVSNVR
jgi:hypothetical protein